MNAHNKRFEREELRALVNSWMDAWNRHDFVQVMALFADDAEFISWSGVCVSGLSALKKAWEPWFNNHQNFHFEVEQMVVDEQQQRVVITWQLDWLSHEPGYQGEREIRRGIDFLQFDDGLLKTKHSYSQTVLKIADRAKRLYLK